MGKAQSKSMNVTTAEQAKAGTVEEGAGKVGKIEENPAAAVNGDANHETVRIRRTWEGGVGGGAVITLCRDR